MNVDKHPYLKKGVYFSINTRSGNTGTIWGVKRISASNTDPFIDPNIYEIPLTPATTANLICERGNDDEFTGQHGIYRVAVERFDPLGNPIIQYFDTDDFPQGLTPIPTPQNLTVSFESGSTTPTLSLDPIEIPGVYYDLRIYDKDYTRRIYSFRVYYPDYPSVTFPAGRIPPPYGYWGTTAEDLVPGEKYIFRVNIFKDLPVLGVPAPYNQLLSTNLIQFKIPKE